MWTVIEWRSPLFILHIPNNSHYALFLLSQRRTFHDKCTGGVTHQADQLSVKPAQDIWSLLRFCSKDSKTSHENRSRFLIKGWLNVLNLCLGICPTWVGTERGREKKPEKDGWMWESCEWRTYTEGVVLNGKNANNLYNEANIDFAGHHSWQNSKVRCLLLTFSQLSNKGASLFIILCWHGMRHE